MAAKEVKSQRGGKLSKTKKQEPAMRVPLPVRITPDLLDRIDEVRPDLIPREPYVRHLIELGLDLVESEG